MTQVHSSRVTNGAFLILGVLLIAIGLRSPITGVGPLLEQMQQQLSLSATQAGMLTTLPLLVFACFSPIASKIGRRIGLERALMLSLFCLLIGITVRSFGSLTSLFGGTLIIGVGIAIANVLLPSLMKRDFPTKVATITSIYVLMMGVGSALSASLAIPMMHLADSLSISFIPNWAFALGGIIIFPIIAIFVWLPQIKNRTKPTQDTLEFDSHSYIWYSASAWQITLFLALNSFLMYTFISWLPSILIDSGYSHENAGVIHGLLQLFTAVPAIIMIPMMAKMKDKRLLSTGLTSLVLISILGFILLPTLAIVWSMMFGFGAGGGFILALTLISIRTSDPHQAASLSGMAQCLGYLLAASGPVLIGAVHEASGSWTLPLLICVFANVLWIIFSFFASKSELILSPQQDELAQQTLAQQV
ncbi:MFS transporter [Shewanella eurypsychrophilus]|uniref:MFS transporter n=1 Tax=Shewanella eurypsychrophilus TaxID=2593656 RepID=A0ABX8S4J5_9GAMM|nr:MULTISPECIES: MFS transporter [Shewanella]QFU24291.1 MFS transporter [Shewanella sp. YLB-09]QXP44915.1 MFS transporter [Shewanella eurypsychrophilus]